MSDHDEISGSLLLSRSRFQYTNEELILEDKIATAKKYYELKLMRNAFKMWREMARTSVIRQKLGFESLSSSEDEASDAEAPTQRLESGANGGNIGKSGALSSGKTVGMDVEGTGDGEGAELDAPKAKKAKKAKLIPGRTGLRNLGNTCFMNSVLQALAGIPKFRKYFINMLWINQEKKNRAILDKNPHFLTNSESGNNDNGNNVGNGRGDSSHGTSRHPRSVSKADPSVIVIKHTDECLNSVKQRKTSRRCHQSKEDSNPVSMCQNLHELLRVLWSGKWAVVSPFAMLESLWRVSPGFQGYQQQDAQEFLVTLFGRIQQEVAGGVFQPVCSNSNGVRTVVTDLFQGEIYTQIECESCGNVSAKLETFLDLSLSVPVSKPGDVAKTSRHKIESNDNNDIKVKSENTVDIKVKSEDIISDNDDIDNQKHPNEPFNEDSKCSSVDRVDLEQCLHKFMDSERLGDDYVCDGCHHKTNPTKACRLYKLPKVLCFVLKRFLWTGKGCGFSKIIKSVSFPLVIDIGPFCCKSSFEGKSMRYSLQSMVCHHGSGLYSGHYTAYTTDGKCWTHFNDSVVTTVDELDVLNDGRKSGYIFFYQCIEEEIPDPFDLPGPLRMAASLKKSLSSSFSSSSLILSASSSMYMPLLSSSSSSLSLTHPHSSNNNNNNNNNGDGDNDNESKHIRRYSLRNQRYSDSELSLSPPKKSLSLKKSKLTVEVDIDDDEGGDNDDIVIVSDKKENKKDAKSVNKKGIAKDDDKKIGKDKKGRYSLRDNPKESKKRRLDEMSPSERYNTKRERLDFPDPEPKRKKPKSKIKTKTSK